MEDEEENLGFEEKEKEIFCSGFDMFKDVHRRNESAPALLDCFLSTGNQNC